MLRVSCAKFAVLRHVADSQLLEADDWRDRWIISNVKRRDLRDIEIRSDFLR